MERAELLQLIDEAEQDGRKELDLSGKGLTEVPPEIDKLSDLEILDLAGNKLTTLPAEISQLSKLQNLGLAGNELTTLPAEIGQLSKLIDLNLARNQLTDIPPEIGGLTELEHLYLGHNQLVKVPLEISQLSKLTSLVLSGNKFTTFPIEISNLTSLKSLSLADNALSTVPPEIGQLTNLKFLFLAGNQLEELPPEIGRLINLESFDLSNNQLTTLPDEIDDLRELRSLELFNNQLTKLPDKIGKDHQVRVTVGGNPRFKQKDDSRVHIEYGPGTQNKRLNEAKMILLGRASGGKTSLVKRLIEDAYNRHETTTQGISIRQWSMPINEDNEDNEETFRLNIWDFGGQDIMYAAHELFLSKRSLYLLVLHTEQPRPERSLEDWLNMIRNCDPKARVIVVMNKIDKKHGKYFKLYDYKKKYPDNIKAFVNTSCRTGEGIGYLKACIQREICQLDHIGKLWPNSWFTTKNELEEKATYFSYDQYQSKCHKQSIDKPQEQEDLLYLLRDLGVVTLDTKSQPSHIFNSEWLINGVYKILNHDITRLNKGQLSHSQLQTILNQADYANNDLMKMMEKFELCFEKKEQGTNQSSFLIPDLFSKDKPKFYSWEKAKRLGFQFKYKVLPKSIISRFIVRMHIHMPDHIQPNEVWRHGMILSNDKTSADEAWVEADDDEKEIKVWVKGHENSKATQENFLSTILSHFFHIHSTITEIEVKEECLLWWGLPGQPIPYYQEWSERRKHGELKYEYPQTGKKINITSLVDKIEEKRKPTLIPKKRDFIPTREIEDLLDQRARRYVERIGVWSRRTGKMLVIGVFIVLLEVVGWDKLNPWAWLLFDQGLLKSFVGLALSAAIYKLYSKMIDFFDDQILQWQRKKEYEKFSQLGIELADDQ